MDSMQALSAFLMFKSQRTLKNQDAHLACCAHHPHATCHASRPDWAWRDLRFVTPFSQFWRVGHLFKNVTCHKAWWVGHISTVVGEKGGLVSAADAESVCIVSLNGQIIDAMQASQPVWGRGRHAKHADVLYSLKFWVTNDRSNKE